MRDNFVWYVIAGTVFIYFLMIQVRRFRWKVMAKRLGARFVSMGPFKTGRIEGETGGRRYIVGTDVRTSGVFIPFAYQGIPLSLSTQFFTSFPDWYHAVTIGDRRESCFVTHVTLKGAHILLPKEYQDQVQRTFQPLCRFFPTAERLLNGCLKLRPEGAEFAITGITYDPEQIDTITSLVSDHRVGGKAPNRKSRRIRGRQGESREQALRLLLVCPQRS